MIRRLLFALRSSYAWMRAVSYYENGKHDAALKELFTFPSVNRCGGPTAKAPLRVNTLIATMAYWTGQPLLAHNAIQVAIQQSDSGQSVYNDETNDYIYNYLMFLDQLCQIQYSGKYDCLSDKYVTFKNILQLDKIRAEVRRVFNIDYGVLRHLERTAP